MDRKLNVAKGSRDDLGRGPHPRSLTSSAETRSCRGADGAQPPTAGGAANLEAIAAGKHGAVAPGRLAEERPSAKPAGRAAPLAAPQVQGCAASSPGMDYVPAWMRTPSWLYLPHLVPPATSMHVETVGGQGQFVGADGGAKSPTIRGRGTSPGTRKPTPLDRARERLAARNAHLATSLSHHAERVEKRKAQAAPTTGTATATERLAAIRRRLAARLEKDAMQTAPMSQDAMVPANSEMAASSTWQKNGRAQRGVHALDADDGNGRTGSDATAELHVEHLRVRECVAMPSNEQMRHRQLVSHGSGALTEGDATPETGTWSIEDRKINYHQLHADGIRMTTACQRRGYNECNSGAAGAAEDPGGGVMHRPLEAEGRRGGNVAPPDAASSAAASSVAWHTTAGSIRNDR